jgi:transcriptional regulator GlxA family with amidase domain
MKSRIKVAILNFYGVVPTSVSGPRDMLADVELVSNALQVSSKAFFDTDVLNTSRDVLNREFNVVSNGSIHNRKKYDLIIIPAMNFNCIEQTLRQEKEAIDWIRLQHRKGSLITSICLGAFLLAATGLLDGKKATTHWIGAPYFRQRFPKVRLEDEKVIIDEETICTCGAAYSFTSLMIYLVEKLCGREMALAMAKVFMIEIHNASQHSFRIFNLQLSHADTVIRKVQLYIEGNFSKKLVVSEIAEKFNMSQRTFIRKFTDATGNKPLQYIQRVKIESAKRLLEKGKMTIQQVSNYTGYEDFNSFRQRFKKVTGLTPAAYKRKYHKLFSNPVVG